MLGVPYLIVGRKNYVEENKVRKIHLRYLKFQGSEGDISDTHYLSNNREKVLSYSEKSLH